MLALCLWIENKLCCTINRIGVPYRFVLSRHIRNNVHLPGEERRSLGELRLNWYVVEVKGLVELNRYLACFQAIGLTNGEMRMLQSPSREYSSIRLKLVRIRMILMQVLIATLVYQPQLL